MFSRLFPRTLFNKLHSNFSIKTRLIFYFLLLVSISTAIISISVYSKSKDAITKDVYSSIDTSLNTLETSILQKFEVINDISTFIYLNPELIDILSNMQTTTNKSDIISEVAVFDRMLEGYNIPKKAKTNIYPRFYIHNRPEYSLYTVSDKIFDLGSIISEKWYRTITPAEAYTVVGLSKYKKVSGDINTVKAAKMLFGLKNKEIPYAGLLTIDIDVSDFNAILKDFTPSRKCSTFLIDNNNSMVASQTNYSTIGSYSDTAPPLSPKELSGTGGNYIKKIGNSDFLVSYKKIQPINWTIISISPLNDLYAGLNSLNKVFVIVIICCIILAFFISLMLSESISYPVRKLVKSMSNVQSGNFEIELDYRRKDEFSFLIAKYNEMVSKIGELIDQLYKSELSKKEAELKSLQAQINPHFLYNTLDSINWLAIKHNVHDISTMVTSLSNFFRYSLNKGKDIITLENEKRQVESYLSIQKIRFKDKIDYHIDFPHEVLNCLTVKLVLQPFIENAIIHGIEKRRGKGTITLSAVKRDNRIEICITDDGKGADVAELNSMLGSTEPSSRGYGVKNVNDRIKQTFGNCYGVEFFNNDPNGVIVKIRIPALNTMEGYYAEDDNCR